MHQEQPPKCYQQLQSSRKLGSGQEGSGTRGYEGTGRQGYALDQQCLLRYEGRDVVPLQKSFIQELLYLYHDDQLARHWVSTRLRSYQNASSIGQVQRRMSGNTTTCSSCQNRAICRHKPHGKLEPLPVPEQPQQEVSLNFITWLLSSYVRTTEYDAILVVADRYAEMARFIPITTDLDAPKFAALFYENVELKYGSPRDIVPDRDTKITSKFWAEVCSYSLIKRRLSTAFSPVNRRPNRNPESNIRRLPSSLYYP